MSEAKVYLLTGATGFLGRHVLQTLQQLEQNSKVYVLVRDPQSFYNMDWTNALHNVEVICGDVVGDAAWQNDPRLHHLDGVFHLAALVQHGRENAEPVYKINVEGTCNMVRFAATRKARMVFVSTSGTVGCFPTSIQSADESAAFCEAQVSGWPYYDSKIKAEKAARVLATELGVELVFIRPPVLLGPGDHRFRSTGHVIRMLRGKLPFLIAGGIHFVDIRDVAQAIARAMAIRDPRPIYHMTGTSCSVEEFFSRIERLSGVKKPKWKLSATLALKLSYLAGKIEKLMGWRHGSILPDPVVIEMASKYWGLMSRYAQEDLGFRSRPGNQTLADTIRWLRQNHPELKKQNEEPVTEVSVRARLIF